MDPDLCHNAGRRIAIIGGGIGGLTAALGFAQSGAEVHLYEQAPALTEVGAGLQITPNGHRALIALGLSSALAQKSLIAAAVCPMDAQRGSEVTRFDLSTQSPPYIFMHRAGLIGVLAEACEKAGVALHLNRKIASPGDPACQEADLVVGADGLHSGLRRALNPGEEAFFTGQVAWRAIIPQAEAAPIARVWMAPGRHLVTYPLPDARLNIVAVEERSTWAAEGWHHPDAPDNLRTAFAGCAAPVQDILSKVTTCHLWGLFRHPVAPVWQDGSTALLGDAAHPTLPFLAQGANLAIEDAFVLARLSGQSADLPAALRRYQTLRQPRVIRAIAAANANARTYHLGGLSRLIAHACLRSLGHLAPKAFLNRLSWLYDYDVTAQVARP